MIYWLYAAAATILTLLVIAYDGGRVDPANKRNK